MTEHHLPQKKHVTVSDWQYLLQLDENRPRRALDRGEAGRAITTADYFGRIFPAPV